MKQAYHFMVGGIVALSALMLWVQSASAQESGDSSIIFTRDTLMIESVVKTPITRIIEPLPWKGQPAATVTNIPTNTNALTRWTTPPVAAQKPEPEVKEEIVTSKRQHQFYITINSANSLEADWIVDMGEIHGDYGVMYVFSTPSPASIPPSESEQTYDILFLNGYGQIITIAQDIAAASLAEPIKVDRPVKALIYLEAGTAKSRGINVSDRVIHSLFPEPPSILNDTPTP
jgi:uncharacterized membrane protein (UPF0127 family)